LPRATAFTRPARDERVDGVAAAVEAAYDLVPEHERGHAWARMSPIAVEVGTADAGELNVEDDLVVVRLRVGDVLEPELPVPVPDERLHAAIIGSTVNA